jgi:tetratricopeptide (TPR) repeat protein
MGSLRSNVGSRRPTAPGRAARLAAAVLASAGLVGAAVRAGEADDAYQRAMKALQGGDLNRAVDDLNAAIRLDPNRPRFHGMRGVAYIRQGQRVKGIDDLKTAVRLNPGDAGANYRPSSGAQLTPEAIRHGQQQVDKMLRDRPAMNRYGRESDFLRQWAERKFAGEDFGQPIVWDSSPPLHSDAENLAPTEDEPGAILVEAVYSSGPKRGAERSFEELWAGAVFELHNINYAKEFVRLNDEAAEGKVSKKDFVAGILKYELRAAQQTRAFYVQVFLPWAEKQKLASDPSLWFADWWPEPDQLQHGFSDEAAYPWRPYGRQHDWATVHLRWRQGKLKKALKLLEEMLAVQGYEAEATDVQMWIGRCQARLGKPAAAIAAFTEVIRLDPEDPDAYQARGEVYRQIGDTKKADADSAKAKQLEAEEEKDQDTLANPDKVK